MNHKVTAVWQMAKWEMRGFQNSFPRLKEMIKFEEQKDHQVNNKVTAARQMAEWGMWGF